MKYLRTILICSLPALLAACGGGDGSPSGAVSPEAGIDPYMGTWVFCMPGSPTSIQLSLQLDKTSDTTARMLHERATYQASTCSGEPVTRRTVNQGTVRFTGTNQIGEDTAAKVDIQLDPASDDVVANDSKSSPGKQIYLIRADGKLYSGVGPGSASATFDAQGYPGLINLDFGFTRR